MRNTGATGPPVSYQSVKLARGKHSSPSEEVCVMELASMLAGEPFSDHPRSACPVIGAFLRTYNDRLDDHWRQDLYEHAAKVVGTRSTRTVERRRAQMCSEWTERISACGVPRRRPIARLPRAGRLRRWYQGRRLEHTARRAALMLARREVDRGGHKLPHQLHLEALRLIDALITVGTCEELDRLDLLAMTSRQPLVRRWEIDRDPNPQGGHDARQRVPDHNP